MAHQAAAFIPEGRGQGRPNRSRKELPKTTGNLESVVASFVFVGCFAGAFSAKIRTYCRNE